MDGILVINKPLDWTSFDVCKKVRNLLGAKKVGHTGTLDPLATGVLVLAIGKATQKIQEMTALDKEYVAEITLGAQSETDDAEGEIIQDPLAQPASREEIEETLKSFRGTFKQVPPIFSAKKVSGQRAYDAARKGKELILEPVDVIVHKLEILDYHWPKLTLQIHCGKGFYVRALARDIGAHLLVGGYLSKLERTRVGKYTIDQAIKIEEVSPARVLTI